MWICKRIRECERVRVYKLVIYLKHVKIFWVQRSLKHVYARWKILGWWRINGRIHYKRVINARRIEIGFLLCVTGQTDSEIMATELCNKLVEQKVMYKTYERMRMNLIISFLKENPVNIISISKRVTAARPWHVYGSFP